MGLKLKGKKSILIHKTWERCRSFRSSSGSKNIVSTRSWPSSPVSLEESTHKMKGRAVPEGCFSIYVGPHRQRFLVKTACINHPLFKILLEEAEKEYGYNCDGPCDVEDFYKVLAVAEEGDEIRQGCTLAMGYGLYHLLNEIAHLECCLELILIIQNW